MVALEFRVSDYRLNYLIVLKSITKYTLCFISLFSYFNNNKKITTANAYRFDVRLLNVILCKR